MNPTRTCPRCGHANFAAHTFCSSCGQSLTGAKASKGYGWKLFFAVFAIFAGVVWASVIYTQPKQEASLPPSPPLALTGSNPSAQTPVAQLELTSAQHLAEAKRALGDGYKPNKDPKKASWGEVEAARWHLKAIGAGTPEYREAQELLKEVARRERQQELAKAAESQTTAEQSSVGETAEADSASTTSARQGSSSPSSSAPAAARAGNNQPARSAADSSSYDTYTNVDGQQVRRPTISSTAPEGATAQCRDGSYSFSLHRSGTCSHHGGIARWL
jgi:hypothetical protein